MNMELKMELKMEIETNGVIEVEMEWLQWLSQQM